MESVCRHCRKYRVNRPRGLCCTCYYTPGVKEQYPQPSKTARGGATPAPTRETEAEPAAGWETQYDLGGEG